MVVAGTAVGAGCVGVGVTGGGVGEGLCCVAVTALGDVVAIGAAAKATARDGAVASNLRALSGSTSEKAITSTQPKMARVPSEPVNRPILFSQLGLTCVAGYRRGCSVATVDWGNWTSENSFSRCSSSNASCFTVSAIQSV